NLPAGVVVLPGNGDGTLQTPGLTDTRQVVTPSGIASGDFNNDGKLDLALSCEGGRGPFSVRLGDGDGTFQRLIVLDPASFAHRGAVADLNGDGNLDVVSSNDGNYAISVYLGNGNGTFQANKKYPGKILGLSLAIGDFNADGRQDLAVVD